MATSNLSDNVLRYVSMLRNFGPQLTKLLNSADDVIIPVMGITGSGKSTFIAHCTGNYDGIGHSLKSREYAHLESWNG